LKNKAAEPIRPEEESKPIGKTDILRIINQAMERNDKQISIFIRGDVMSVNVNPYEADDPRWIKRDYNCYECSACGQVTEYPIMYCTYCGERPRWNRDCEVDGDTE
jgi:hypothetical protein